jgi:hypothetical protein
MSNIAISDLILRSAHAYLDPGSGSYLLQLLIAGALGAAFALRMFWGRIKGFFSRIFFGGQDEED